MAIVGPGSIQEQQLDIKPILDGMSDMEYATLVNPLSDDFAVRVAQDVPVNMPLEIRAGTGLVQSERDVTSAYGLQLKNGDFQGRKHIHNDTVIKAGGTINLKGSEAQVAMRQLTNELMQREGNTRLLSDPVLRKQTEERILVHRGSVQELMESNIQSQQVQIDVALTKSNEVRDETVIPGTAGQATTDQDSGAGAETQQSTVSGTVSPRPVGRPKKTDS